MGRLRGREVAQIPGLHYRRGVIAPLWPTCLAALVLGAGLAPAPAEASPGESALSSSLGYAGYTLSDQEHSDAGALLGIEYERGITDALWLRGQAGFGAYPFGAWSHSGDATLGLTYAIDVLKYIPYVKAGAGALVVGGSDVDARLYPLVEAGAGFDVLHSRSLSYGLEARVETFVEGTAFFTAGVHVSYRWGFF